MRTRIAVLVICGLAALAGRYAPELSEVTCSAGVVNGAILIAVCLVLLCGVVYDTTCNPPGDQR
jgi:hypothetical protein